MKTRKSICLILQTHVIFHKQLSHYLDIVEVRIAEQVASKSQAFFHAMTSHDALMEQLTQTITVLKALRKNIHQIDKSLVIDSLDILRSVKLNCSSFDVLLTKNCLVADDTNIDYFSSLQFGKSSIESNAHPRKIKAHGNCASESTDDSVIALDTRLRGSSRSHINDSGNLTSRTQWSSQLQVQLLSLIILPS